MKDWRGGSYGGGSDETVDEPADGLALPPASPVEGGSLFIISRLGSKQRRSSKQSTKPAEVLVVACSGEHLHAHGVAGGYLVL